MRVEGLFIDLVSPLLKHEGLKEFKLGVTMSLQILEVKQLEVERSLLEGILHVLIDKIYNQLTLIDEELQSKSITEQSPR